MLSILSKSSKSEVSDKNEKFPITNDTKINNILQKHSKVFSGIGKCKNKIITVHAKENAKPCIQPIRPIPFHLRKKFDSTVQDMIDQGVFEEYSGSAEWISNPVIIPKDDGSIRISKLDLNQAFFQFEISEQSKSFTTFYGNGNYNYNQPFQF